MPALVSALSITGFRSIQHSRLELGPLCALVGEPETGKFNLLVALRTVLDPSCELVVGEGFGRLAGGGRFPRVTVTDHDDASDVHAGRALTSAGCHAPTGP